MKGNATGSRTAMEWLYCEICMLFQARGVRFSLLGFLLDVANSDGRTVTLAYSSHLGWSPYAHASSQLLMLLNPSHRLPWWSYSCTHAIFPFI